MTPEQHIAAIKKEMADASMAGAEVAVSMRKLDEMETLFGVYEEALKEIAGLNKAGHCDPSWYAVRARIALGIPRGRME